MNNQYKKTSKMISLILRHNPGYINTSLDENGWLPVDELIIGIRSKGINIDRKILKEIVETNNKKRFTFSDDMMRIRANQGHSLEVDVELKEVEPPEYLFHGTVDRFMQSIRKDGLLKMNRQHVHLSKDRETAVNVGSRRGKPVILTVRTGEMYRDGFSFFLSENGVWLTEHIQPKYLELK